MVFVDKAQSPGGMGHPCPASDECAIHYNTRHTDPGSGAGAPPQIRSCGRDIPVGSCRSASRRTGSATAIGEQSACPECRNASVIWREIHSAVGFVATPSLGWAAGVGFDVALSSNLSARLE